MQSLCSASVPAHQEYTLTAAAVRWEAAVVPRTPRRTVKTSDATSVTSKSSLSISRRLRCWMRLLGLTVTVAEVTELLMAPSKAQASGQAMSLSRTRLRRASLVSPAMGAPVRQRLDGPGY